MRIIIILIVTFYVSQSFALTLQEAIRYTVQTNTGVLADEASLVVAEKQVQAAWLNSFSPSVYANYGSTNNRYDRTYMGQNGTSSNWNYGVSLPLFSGGASYYNIQAQKDNLSAQNFGVAQAKTRTAISSVEAYVAVLRSAELVRFFNNLEKMYADLKPLCTNQDELSLVNNKISELNGSVISLLSALKVSKKIFFNRVGLQPDDRSQSASQIIEEYLPPEDYKLALSLALANNPSLLESSQLIEAQKNNAKSTLAKSISPQISVYAQKYNYTEQGDHLPTGGTEVGINITIPLNLSGIPATQAQYKQIEVLELKKSLCSQTLRLI